MLSSNQKTSLLIPSQLPAFIRDNPDYANFVTFIQAYYEWMEQNGGVTDGIKNLTNYFDVDNTTSDFLNYFVNDFLAYFPEDALISKEKAVKFAKQLYLTKGTPASYKFLFKILYDSDFDYINTGDFTFKASDGTWYVPKSLKLATDDIRFLQLNSTSSGTYRVFGETSKSFATIEYVTFASNKTEIFISDIERLFESGETVRIVDANNQDIIINGSNLRAKLVGQISQININPNNRGLFYSSGDPVIVEYDGLNYIEGQTPVGATAEVGTVTSGSVQKITVNNGGYGYTLGNTAIIFSNLNAGAATPIAEVGSVSPTGIANVSLIPSDTITLKKDHYIGNIAGSSGANTHNPTTGLWTQQAYQFANNLTANANTTLANAFTMLAFSTYPLSSVLVENGGGGITIAPTVTAQSNYPTDISGQVSQLGNLGILAPIQIANGGNGYVVNDKINFIGGTGYGAYANVTSVDANGSITSVSYVYKTNETLHNHYPLGGMGFEQTALPTLTVTSANTQASNASLYVPSILGVGAELSTSVDRAGSITSINITNPGEDYIKTPSVSLKVQDILVSNVSVNNIPDLDDIVFQGGSGPNNAIYYSNYASLKEVIPNNDPTQSVWVMRVYNYNSQPNTQLPFTIQSQLLFSVNNPQVDTTRLQIVNSSYAANALYVGSPAFTNGVKNYGDGTALATAKFLNGLVIGQGQYIDARSQPSGYSVIQSKTFNNYTYKITVNKEIQKYREILLNLLHPSGTNLIGRYAIKDFAVYNTNLTQQTNKGYNLYHYTQTYASNVSMQTSMMNLSNNIIKFNNLSGANLGNIIFANASFITINSHEGTNVSALITNVDYANNQATLSSNVFLTYPNVAFISANSNTTTININNLTNSYDIINNGNYSNTAYPLMDIVYVGDTISVGPPSSNVFSVASSNSNLGTIVTTANIGFTTTNVAVYVSTYGEFLSYLKLGYAEALSANSTTLNMVSVANSYNIMDVVSSGSEILLGNITPRNDYLVTGVDAVNGIITVSSNVSTNTTNSSLSVIRSFTAGGDSSNVNKIIIFNTIGTQFYPELTTENDISITTEAGDYILLG